MGALVGPDPRGYSANRDLGPTGHIGLPLERGQNSNVFLMPNDSTRSYFGSSPSVWLRSMRFAQAQVVRVRALVSSPTFRWPPPPPTLPIPLGRGLGWTNPRHFSLASRAVELSPDHFLDHRGSADPLCPRETSPLPFPRSTFRPLFDHFPRHFSRHFSTTVQNHFISGPTFQNHFPRHFSTTFPRRPYLCTKSRYA